MAFYHVISRAGQNQIKKNFSGAIAYLSRNLVKVPLEHKHEGTELFSSHGLTPLTALYRLENTRMSHIKSMVNISRNVINIPHPGTGLNF